MTTKLPPNPTKSSPLYNASFRLRFLQLAVLVLFVLSAGTGFSLDVDRGEAKAKFNEGMVKIRDKDFAGALESFEASYKLKPKPVVMFNIAMCEKALFQYAEALRAFEEYLATAGEAPSPDLRDEAFKAIAEIEQLVGKVILKGAPDGAEVYFDGVLLGKTPFAKPLAMNPGRYKVRIAHEGSEMETVAAVMAGAVTTVNVNMDPVGPGPGGGGGKPRPPAPEPQGGPPDALEISKFGTLALGVAAAITGAVFTSRAYSAYQDGTYMVYSAEMPGTFVSVSQEDEYAELRKELDTNRKGAIISFSVAAALLGAGAVLAIVDARKDRKNVAVRVSPLGITGEF